MAEQAADKRARIVAALRSLPVDAAARLVEAVGVFEPLRPFLRSPGEKSSKRHGVIARSSLAPVWGWIAADLVPRQAAEVLETAAGMAAGEALPSRAVVRALQVRAGVAMLDAFAEEGGEAAILTKLGSKRAVEDAREMAGILACTELFLEIERRVPKDSRDLDEGQVNFLRDRHDQVVANVAVAAPLVLLSAMFQLGRPALIFRVVTKITRQEHDFLVEDTDFGVIGDAMLDEAEEAMDGFELKKQAFDAEAALAALERFAAIVSGMAEEFQIRKSGRWGKRLFELRGRGARRLEGICAASVEAIAKASPRNESRRPGWSLDLRTVPTEEAVQNAVQFARFLVGAKVLDERAAFAAARVRALRIVRERLEGQSDALLGVIQSGDGRREIAHAQLLALAEVIAAVEGEAPADVLRRRAAAAA